VDDDTARELAEMGLTVEKVTTNQGATRTVDRPFRVKGKALFIDFGKVKTSQSGASGIWLPRRGWHLLTGRMTKWISTCIHGKKPMYRLKATKEATDAKGG